MAVTDIVNTVLLTGPTRGLGREAAVAVAKRGHHLVLLGRSSAAFTRIEDESRRAGAAEVTLVEADMASLASVSSAATKVASMVRSGSIGPLNTIIGNAGIQHVTGTEQSADGIEATMAVNVVANHRLVTELLDSLAPAAHVVLVGSGTHYGQFPATLLVAGPKWADPTDLFRTDRPEARARRAGQRAYSTSKLGVNYLVADLQHRYGDRARFNVYDPGLMPGTGLVRTGPAWRRWVWRNVMPALTVLPGVTTPSHSGEMLARFALGIDHTTLAGGYVEIERQTSASAESSDPARARALFEACSSLA